MKTAYAKPTLELFSPIVDEDEGYTELLKRLNPVLLCPSCACDSCNSGCDCICVCICIGGCICVGPI
jgi:hypothetical protein